MCETLEKRTKTPHKRDPSLKHDELQHKYAHVCTHDPPDACSQRLGTANLILLECQTQSLVYNCGGWGGAGFGTSNQRSTHTQERWLTLLGWVREASATPNGGHHKTRVTRQLPPTRVAPFTSGRWLSNNWKRGIPPQCAHILLCPCQNPLRRRLRLKKKWPEASIAYGI